ncbi:MAG: hypothetical protein HIU83_15250 [Proteobacteria bacterium]|nr:hypothetical protein [Pseudomonadota bacterium]
MEEHLLNETNIESSGIKNTTDIDVIQTESPETVMSKSDLRHIACEEKEKRQYIAKKILSGKRLDKDEKEMAYTIISGHRPPILKVGPKTKDLSYRCLAIDFLEILEHLHSNSNVISREDKEKIRRNLGIEYELQGRENVSKENFMIAVNKGIDSIIDRCSSRIATTHEESKYSGFYKLDKRWLQLATGYKNKRRTKKNSEKEPSSEK